MGESVTCRLADFFSTPRLLDSSTPRLLDSTMTAALVSAAVIVCSSVRAAGGPPAVVQAVWSAAMTRAGVNGTVRRRTPVASKMALPTAADMGQVEISPAPQAG